MMDIIFRKYLGSKTLQGIALLAFSYFAPKLGIDIPPGLMDSLSGLVGASVPPDLARDVTAACGLAWGVFGRITAKKPLPMPGKSISGLLLGACLAGSLSACAFIGAQGDKYLGACEDGAVILARDTQFTDMLAKYYGESTVDDLREALNVLDQTVQAKKPIDAAQDAYRLRFVSFVIHRGVVTGIKIAAGNFDVVIDKMQALPDFRADIAAIKARTVLACPDLVKS